MKYYEIPWETRLEAGKYIAEKFMRGELSLPDRRMVELVISRCDLWPKYFLRPGWPGKTNNAYNPYWDGAVGNAEIVPLASIWEPRKRDEKFLFDALALAFSTESVPLQVDKE